MTARAESLGPVSIASRLHLIGHRDELRELSTVVDQVQADLRTDAQLGTPIPDDARRVVSEARDLLILASNMLDPDRNQERDR